MPARYVYAVEVTRRALIHAASTSEAIDKFNSEEKSLTNPEPETIRVEIKRDH